MNKLTNNPTLRETMERVKEQISNAIERGNFNALIATDDLRTILAALNPDGSREQIAFDAAIDGLGWRNNPHLLQAAEQLRDAGYNNGGGFMSNYMAQRMISAWLGARAAINTLFGERS